MKLEIGMYVRTKNGEIGKIRAIIDGLVFINTNQYYSTITKASHNIIDLIEEGDYVNGFEVQSKDKNEKTVICYTATFFEDEIETIVTKEQFESMSYKVGE